eukprot:gene16380-18019_t
MHSQLVQLASFALPESRIRSCRRLARNQGWWEHVWTTYDNDRFKRTFHMSRETFLHILHKVYNKLLKEVVVETPVSPETRLAICIYRLARGDYLYTISEMVGLAESTICRIVKKVCEIVETLWSDAVDKYFPKTEDEFKNCLLDMDGKCTVLKEIAADK